MKKSFLYHALVIVCLTLGMTLGSCSKDNDPSPDDGQKPSGKNLVEQLQGTWQFELMKIEVMGQTIEMDIDDLRNNSQYDDFYDDVLTFDGDTVNGSPYTVKGNKIMFPWYEELDWWASVSFSGSTMKMFYDIDYQGISMKLTLNYRKSGYKPMPDSATKSSIISNAIATLKP